LHELTQVKQALTRRNDRQAVRFLRQVVLFLHALRGNQTTMDTLTPREFRRLAQVTEPWCVSLLMPTHPTGRETKQDPIRFKNLLKQAEAGLTARGRQAADAREQLVPLARVLDDVSFWAHQDEGLAAYCMPDESHLYAVPFCPPERVVVGRRCYLVPLLPIVSENQRFYVLALSPKQVRLLEGTRHTARELALPGWPERFEELARYIEEESQLQFHTKAPPAGQRGDRAAMFHGHPGEDESSERKQRLLEYCRLVDERVREALGSERTPLVLACEKRLASIYRQTSDYPHVIEQPVAGSPNSRKPADLCSEAWKLMEPELRQSHHAALSRYHEAAAAGRGAPTLAALLPAAHEGKVDTLLVAADAECWGRYDYRTRRLDVHEEPSPDDEELVNLATVTSFTQGADVYILPREELPEKESAVAVLRY
jgi:hypothetical protein